MLRPDPRSSSTTYLQHSTPRVLQREVTAPLTMPMVADNWRIEMYIMYFSENGKRYSVAVDNMAAAKAIWDTLTALGHEAICTRP